jgi:formamidopyrimidine-DNA glycosylase
VPEYPDIEVYIDCLKPRVLGQSLERVRLFNPFLLRTYDPPLEAIHGKPVLALSRLGKRIVFHFEDELYAVLHLMIAGRLHWKPVGARPPGKIGLAAFDFPTGSLTLTEAGSKRRASLFIVRGRSALAAHDPGGLEVMTATPDEFAAVLVRENRASSAASATRTPMRSFSAPACRHWC